MPDKSGGGPVSDESRGTPPKQDAKAEKAPGLFREPGSSVYSNGHPLKPNYERATLELIGFFAFAEAWYWATITEPEWYWYNNLAEYLRGRFVTGDAYCLDVNSWATNANHVYAGAAYYMLARSNDLSVEGSMIAAVAMSTAWELFGEPREEFSINDAVMTPFGGLAVGEAMHQLGEFFQHSSDSVPNRVLGYMFSPFMGIHRWWDNDIPKPPVKTDKFGFTTDAWHRFRLSAGGGGTYSPDADKTRTETFFGLDLQVVTAEKYGKPGEASLWYKGGTFNEVAFSVDMDGTDMPDFQLFFKSAYLGHYQQNIFKFANSDTIEGTSLYCGLSSAFEYYTHKYVGYEREDKLAIVDLVGPTLVSDYYHCGFHMRTTLDASPTFSMVQPAAGGIYDRTHSIVGVTGVYQEQSYYYALGVATGARTEMEQGPFGLEGIIRYHYFSGITGIDRTQDRVTHDLDFEDQRLWLQLTLYCALPVDHLKVALDAGKIYRWSNIDYFSDGVDETRYFARLVYEF